MASGRFTGASNNGRYLYIDWSTSGSTLTASLYLVGNVTGNALSGSNFTVDGSVYSIAQYWDNWGTGTPLLLKTVSKNVSGKSSVAMSGYFLYNGSFTSVSVSGTASIATIPSAPTNLKHTGRFENGMTTSGTWTGVSGATGYDVQRRFWKKRDNSYSDWHAVAWNSASTSITIQHSAVDDNAQQLQVRSVNSAGSSAWVLSDWVYHDGVGVFNNNNRVCGKIRVWNGSAWVQGYLSVWNGSSWRITK